MTACASSPFRACVPLVLVGVHRQGSVRLVTGFSGTAGASLSPLAADSTVGSLASTGRFKRNLSSIQAPSFAHVRRFLLEEDGPTAVEYAVMLALIVVACMNIVTAPGRSTSTTFSRVNSSLAS